MMAGFVGLLLVALGLGGPRQQQADDSRSCGFSVRAELSPVTITGPEDIVPLVYVVRQPDSPVEIVSLNFEGTWLSVSGGRYTEKTCIAYAIHNRSDRTIMGVDVGVVVNYAAGGGYFVPHSRSPLPPGQTAEEKWCNGGSSGDARGDRARLIVSVTGVNLGDCLYWPSVRIPRRLGVSGAW